MESTSFLNSLRVKISMYILIGAIVLSGLIIFVTYHYLDETLSDSLKEQGKIIASSVEELAAERLIEEDVVGLKKIVEKYRHHLSNEYIIIVDADYQAVTDTYNGNVPPELLDPQVYSGFDYSRGKAYDVELLSVAGQEIYDIRLPIKEGLLGFVRVGLKKSFVDERVQTTLFYISMIIAVGTLLAILVSLVVITSQVTRPVLQLTNAAREISLGNFQAPVNVKVKNELQVLAAAIDRMKESLRSSLERLKTRSTIGRF